MTFVVIYSVLTFVITPIVAPIFGREKVKHSEKIRPVSYFTVVLNRNYVRPELTKPPCTKSAGV